MPNTACALMFDEAIEDRPLFASAEPIQTPSCLERIVAVFDREFADVERTKLCPGADEPYYEPASSDWGFHRIYSRADYPASALHEAAHWCLAGSERRLLPDFGYWYAADGRNAEQQREFQRVEAKPQALEWAFSRAVGMRFHVSVDNLEGDTLDPFGFQLAVWQQARAYDLYGLPNRAGRFVAALNREFGQNGESTAMLQALL